MNRFKTSRFLISARTQRGWADALRSIFAGGRPVARLDPGRQSWARRVRARSDIPASFIDALAALPMDGSQPFPYMILMPTFEGIFRHPENERLVCLLGDCVHVLENAAGHISRVCYSPDDILFVERGALLLYSWIKIQGRSRDGTPSCTMLKFNTVTEDVMAPITDCLRSWSQVHESEASAAPPPGFHTLGRANLKFRAYAEASLLPADSVIHWIFQPQIRRPRVAIFGLSLTRPIAAAHLVMLTRRELILISDDEEQQPATGEPYGAIRTYIPRRTIMSASMETESSGLAALKIQFSQGAHIKLKFEPSRMAAIQELLNALAAPEPLTPAIAALA